MMRAVMGDDRTTKPSLCDPAADLWAITLLIVFRLGARMSKMSAWRCVARNSAARNLLA